MIACKTCMQIQPIKQTAHISRRYGNNITAGRHTVVNTVSACKLSSVATREIICRLQMVVVGNAAVPRSQFSEKQIECKTLSSPERRVCVTYLASMPRRLRCYLGHDLTRLHRIRIRLYLGILIFPCCVTT